MKTYSVSEHKSDRKTVEVEAINEWSAVRKADRTITGRRTRDILTWNGQTAAIGDRQYNRPVLVRA